MKYTDNDFRLCYIDGDWAWFTTQDIDKQWGDDWNDAPYEHNAGMPYKWQEYMKVEPYQLKVVAFTGPFDQPCSNTINSNYSVQDINSGGIAWLMGKHHQGSRVNIFAGTTLPEFIKLIKQAGGNVFLSLEEEE